MPKQSRVNGAHHGSAKSRFVLFTCANACPGASERVPTPWGEKKRKTGKVSDQLKYHPMSRLLDCIILRLL